MSSFRQPVVRSTAEAMALFDSLEPMDVEALLGAWTGVGFPTGHPLDGVLEACHWQGKRFDSPEHAHPLVFRTSAGGTVHVNPVLVAAGIPLALRWRFARSAWFGRLFQAALPLLATRKSRARLRMTTHRGRSTATLVYDQLAILDVFRRIDADSVLGLMDLKGMEQPYFFVLRRTR
jgi:GXWXG protein/Domain of unknown function (DUF4334)